MFDLIFNLGLIMHIARQFNKVNWLSAKIQEVIAKLLRLKIDYLFQQWIKLILQEFNMEFKYMSENDKI